jgi:hypothetical protein
MARRLHNLLTTLLSFALVVMLLSTVALATARRARTGEWALPTKDDVIWLKHRLDVRQKPSRTIFINRDAMTFHGGHDDATQNFSSLIPAGQSERVAGFRGTSKQWQRVVSCVEKHFADFNIKIVTERPSGDDYLMVHVGARPRQLRVGKANNLAGIAPFSGNPVPRAIVYAFQQSGRYRTLRTCETIAHEIGHAYGLDHTYRCKDMMSYLSGCGAKRFEKVAAPCGEHEKRACEGGNARQSSYGRLMDVLGPRPELVAKR